LTDFQKIFNSHILWNMSSGSWVVPCGQAGRQTDIRVDGQTDVWTDRHDKANSHFTQICECA